jgi:DNA-directed RNA polymerase subunit E'
MYRILTIKDTVKVPPTRLGMKLKDAIKESIGEEYEGKTDEQLGVGIAVVSVDEVGEGKILPGDPSVYYPATFQLLVYKPELHEVVIGEVIDNTEFGSFIRIGPIDGLVHISQIMDDFVSYDEKNSIFLGKESKRTLKEGDAVRARVIGINLSKSAEKKIGLTMRQPGLGSLTWIREEKKKAKKKVGKKG